MTEPTPQKIEDLELWLPSDSFKQDHNSLRMRDAMPDLQALTILMKPGEEAIYCSGGPDQVIYHVVDGETVGARAVALEETPGDATSCLEADRTISEQELQEEARMRELHLGLGRTSLFLAADAEDSKDFVRAAHDLQFVFEMLDRPIHPLESLSATARHDSGLIYLFIKAARKFKTLSKDDARALSEALGRGILPFPTGKSGKNVGKWATERGPNFIERVGFPPAKLVQTPRGAPRRHRGSQTTEGHFLYSEELPPVAEKRPRHDRTRAEIFIFRLLGDRTHNTYSVKLARAHEAYFGKKRQLFEIRNDTRIDMARLGVEAYLEATRRRGNDAAGQILEYVAKKGGNTRRPLLPLIVMGNLLTARLNANGGIDGQPMELPGLKAQGIPQGFRALRQLFETGGTTQQEADNKLLGDIVSGYLEAAFLPSGEEDKDAPGYETPPAPTDFLSTADFAETHGIDRSILERVLPDYGIDSSTYRFGKYAHKGLSPDNQEVLLGALDELRVERAPKGCRSISTFANLIGTGKSTVDELIAEHGIEAPLRRFGSKLGQSLSPEDQQALARMLGREHRFRPYTGV